MALTIRSQNNITFTYGVDEAQPLSGVNWSRFDLPYFDNAVWVNRKPIVLAAGAGILALVTGALGAVLK